MLRERMDNELEPVEVNRIQNLNWDPIIRATLNDTGKYLEVRIRKAVAKIPASFLLGRGMAMMEYIQH